MPKAKPKPNSKQIMLVLLGLSLVCGSVFFYQKAHAPGNNQQPSAAKESSSQPTGSAPQQFNKQLYSIDDSASLWAVVNKGRVLPANYTPDRLTVPQIPLRLAATAPEMQLRFDAAASLEKMSQAASSKDVNFMLASGYRSYYVQAALNSNYAQAQGQDEADKTSAHAGHSEHQTGLAADLEPTSRNCEIQVCFSETKEGKWLAENAQSFGFVIRYPKDKVAYTGYEFEPWHIRYVGVDLALQLTKQNKSMEEYFGLAFFTTYPPVPFKLQ